MWSLCREINRIINVEFMERSKHKLTNVEFMERNKQYSKSRSEYNTLALSKIHIEKND